MLNKYLVYIAFFLSGLSALVFEVVWFRSLSYVLGSTVWALSTLLSVYMSGLAIGSIIGGKVADRAENPLRYFGMCQLGICITGIISVPVIYQLPYVFYYFYKSFHQMPLLFFVSQFLISSFVMLLPTILMGATFPLVSKAVTKGLNEVGSKVGALYGINTFGAVIGSLLGGFLFIPVFGLKWSAFLAGMINLFIGSVFALRLRKISLFLPVAVIAFIITYAPVMKNPFMTFYTLMRFGDIKDIKEAEKDLQVVYEADHPQGFVRASRSQFGFLTIQISGRLEGTSIADMPNAVAGGVLPYVAFRDAKDGLVIGLGTGVTLMALKENVPAVEVVELHPKVIEAVRRFGIPGLLDGVRLHVTDARRMLAYTTRSYDIITSEPSLPVDQMSSNLFTLEFYRLVSSRLAPEGVFCQWFPAWALTRNDALACIKTLATVFRHIYVFWVIQTMDYMVLASNNPMPESENIISGYMNSFVFPPHIKDMAKTIPREFYEVKSIMTQNDINGILERKDIPLITDDRPNLEFWVATNIMLGSDFKKIRR